MSRDRRPGVWRYAFVATFGAAPLVKVGESRNPHGRMRTLRNLVLIGDGAIGREWPCVRGRDAPAHRRLRDLAGDDDQREYVLGVLDGTAALMCEQLGANDDVARRWVEQLAPSEWYPWSQRLEQLVSELMGQR